MIDVRICFWLNIMRMNGQNLTKFCMHIIIEKIYIEIIKHHFSEICKLLPLIDFRIWFF